MKSIVILLSFFLLNCNKGASPAAPNESGPFMVGVSFTSICCGPPSDDFLKAFASEFNTANKVKLTADIIAGCGREGEFVVLFKPGNVNTAKREKFIADLEKSVQAREAENKRTNSSSGGLSVLHNVHIADYDHCRVKAQNWVY